MTTKEFKEKYPEFAHLEGDELWDKMEDMLVGDPIYVVGIDPYNDTSEGSSLESYSMIIWDFSTGKEVYNSKNDKQCGGNG